MQKNASRRAHVILPVDLIADIDKIVGKRGRSAFLTELAQGAAAWIRQMRSLDDQRIEELERRQEGE